jgi:hypothetical protein
MQTVWRRGCCHCGEMSGSSRAALICHAARKRGGVRRLAPSPVVPPGKAALGSSSHPRPPTSNVDGRVRAWDATRAAPDQSGKRIRAAHPRLGRLLLATDTPQHEVAFRRGETVKTAVSDDI